MTDTEKWDRPWFRKLPIKYKVLWCFILDRCDIAGYWYKDFELASFLIGETFNEKESFDFLSKQIIDANGKWFIVDFASFQYGSFRDSNHPFHKRLVSMIQNDTLSNTLSNRVKDRSQDKDKEKDKEKGGVGDFDAFWGIYPKKKSKVQAYKAWRKLDFSNGLFDKILKAVEKQKLSDQWKKENGQFIPFPATWLNGKRWEDESDHVVLVSKERKPDPKHEACNGTGKLPDGKKCWCF